ncbi:hypothetical protein XENOCAPTIV_015990 [Xenoophorus captivus]|uniref:Uncharacterized protein n=1 Tax=Xenoophorus captivus TaxID=1517983 RepID=A0ABV0RQY7_9TELE
MFPNNVKNFTVNLGFCERNLSFSLGGFLYRRLHTAHSLCNRPTVVTLVLLFQTKRFHLPFTLYMTYYNSIIKCEIFYVEKQKNITTLCTRAQSSPLVDEESGISNKGKTSVFIFLAPPIAKSGAHAYNVISKIYV